MDKKLTIGEKLARLFGMNDFAYELTPKKKDPSWANKKRRRKIAQRDRRFNRRKYNKKYR